MLSLAKSPLAPVLGQRVPLRGPARMLFSSYARTRYQPQKSVTRVTTAAGDIFDADLSSTLEWQLWAFGGYEKHFAELFGYLVRPGDRCVDVGANVGVHTVRLARLVGGDGEVIAIEPDPDVVRANESQHRAQRPGQRPDHHRRRQRAGRRDAAVPAEPARHQPGQGEPPAPPLPDRDHDHGPGGDRRRRLRRRAGLARSRSTWKAMRPPWSAARPTRSPGTRQRSSSSTRPSCSRMPSRRLRSAGSPTPGT